MLCDGVFCTPVKMASHFPRFPRRDVFAGTPVQVQAVLKSGARRLPLSTLPHPPSTLHSLQQRSSMCLAEADNRQRTAGREKKESKTRFDTLQVGGGLPRPAWGRGKFAFLLLFPLGLPAIFFVQGTYFLRTRT